VADHPPLFPLRARTAKRFITSSCVIPKSEGPVHVRAGEAEKKRLSTAPIPYSPIRMRILAFHLTAEDREIDIVVGKC
jgi:hypothetical protein